MAMDTSESPSKFGVKQHNAIHRLTISRLKMKHCPHCDKVYPDDAAFCSADGTALEPRPQQSTEKTPVPKEFDTEDEILPEERPFWANMGFRRFAILFIRLQAIWLFFNAAIDFTYFVQYLIHYMGVNFASKTVMQSAREEIFWVFVRTMVHVAAGIWLIQKSEPFLSWLVKDWIAPPPRNSDQASEEADNDTTDKEE